MKLLCAGVIVPYSPYTLYTMLAGVSECRVRLISLKCNEIYILFGYYFTEW